MSDNKIKFSSKLWDELHLELISEISKEIPFNRNLNYKIDKAEIVYHYTSIEKFLSIIKNQSFYFTNINYLNDSKEFYHGIDIIYETIKDKIEYKEIVSIIKGKIIYFQNSKYESNKFVACFSTKEDLLSQWRAYGNQGKGISLGFDSSEIMNFNNGVISEMYIMYDESGQLRIINEIIYLIIKFYENKKSKVDWLNFDYNELVADKILNVLSEFISAFKHPSFEEEHEFRLEYNKSDSFNLIFKDNIEYRSNDNYVIPYFELKYLANSKLPLKRLIIGPSLDFELNKISIESFLAKYGYKDVEIVPSIIPYRI